MQNYARLIGLDVGTKRTGIAQTDLLKTIASPVGTFPPNEVINELIRIVEKSPVEGFVIGWPLDTDGNEGTATDMVNKFITKLENQFPDIPIYKMDERFTSNNAKQVMLQSGISKKKRREKDRVDRIAAALILQSYLDTNH